MITIIYGPEGSGKTRNANYLKGKYAAKRIVDEWNGVFELKDGDLILTNSCDIILRDMEHKIQIIHIAEALTE